MPEYLDNKTSIETLAQDLYGNLPYHNFQHALEVARRGKEIAQRCADEDVIINVMVVYYALLFHDAGYHEDFSKKSFRSREEYAADLAGQALAKVGFKEDLIWEVQKAIISTHRDGDFKTNEEKAVRAADLASMADDYDKFLDITCLLKQETEILSGQKVPWSEQKKKTQELIEFYLTQDIHLTSSYADKDGSSIFHKKARENLNRFLAEPEERLDQLI